MEKIPLKNAMILWDDKTKEIMVVNHANRSNHGSHLPMSDGACWTAWSQASSQERLLRLYRIGVRLAIDWDIPMEFIEIQFLKIPEYTKHMNAFSDYFCDSGVTPLALK